MKRRITWVSLVLLLVTSLLLVSCAGSTTTSTTSTTITTSTINTTSTTTSTAIVPSTTAASTVTATTTSTGNWWDSLGTPQYGGTLTVSTSTNITASDPYLGSVNTSMSFAWMEQLFTDNWTLNPSIYAFQLSFRPPEDTGGCLAQSWEFSPTDINTYIVTLRQGVYWQNLPPVNGREFTSADVVYHYDRNLGLGNGFTTVSPYWASNPFTSLQSVTATGSFTVSFTWVGTNPESIAENMTTASAIDTIEAPEAVQLYGNLNDWHHSVGTGPFILQDFVDGSSMTLVKNLNYWGYDERYPQNKLPYVDEIKFLIISNTSTALAAMRVGKIDEINGATITNTVVQQMRVTNPEIHSLSTQSFALDVEPKDNVAPFNNINVRIAAQEALDLPTIANTYYQGTANPMPQTLTSYYITGWGWPYPNWPASLQAEYAYNPTNAKALLAAAGYPNGFNTTLYADNTLDMSLLNIFASYEAAIGINVTIQPMVFATLTAFLGSPVYNSGMCERSSGLIGRTLAPLRVLTQFVPGNSVNFEGWNDPAYNFVSLANAATTIDAIKQVDQQANQYVAQQHIVICLDTPNAFFLGTAMAIRLQWSSQCIPVPY